MIKGGGPAMWDTTTPSLQLYLYPWGVVIGASLVGAAYDLTTRRIPNWLTGTLAATGFLSVMWTGGLTGLLDRLVACVILALPYVLLFIFAGGGAGDAKLMGAIGAWVGMANAVLVLICVVVCGALAGIAVTLAKREGRTVAVNLSSMVYGFAAIATGQTSPSKASNLMPPTTAMRLMPYGLSIFAGVCIAALISYVRPLY